MKGEATRYLRTNSNQTNFNKMKFKQTHRLKQRGYNRQEISQELDKVQFNQRPNTLLRTQRNKCTDLVFVTDYCDQINWIKRVINKHWKPVLTNPYLKNILPNKPIVALRTAPSLRNKLVRAKLKPLHGNPTTSNTATDLTIDQTTNTNTTAHPIHTRYPITT